MVNSENTNFQYNRVEFDVLNDFFLELNQDCKANNWVDIEMFYYSKLKNLFRKNQFEKIKVLNDQFADVKDEFEKYISRVVNPTQNLSEHFLPEISNLFLPIHNGESYNTDFIEKLTYKVRDIVEAEKSIYSCVHLLTFNYTSTLDCYEETLNLNDDWKVNHIHGLAESEDNKSEDNKIVFGFGDERDNLFHELENENVNEYLRFMKSSAYLKTKNYFNLLNFIESEEFVVEIFGHSCGLSDRTLLKTIFEHSNCCQIFLSYYKNKDSNNDNFHDLSLNISRHFDDKIMLRRKVANKKFSISLPQRKPTD